MHYRSVFDLNAAIARNIHRIPADIDLVVGVPRSGLLAANLLSLVVNRPLTDLDSYLERRIASSGRTKRQEKLAITFDDVKKVLVLDDSVNVGTAMEVVRERIAAAGFDHEVLTAAVYGVRPDHENVDIVFEVLPQPRIFQWNLMHHNFVERACVDIDGVLCVDPSHDQNDDGDRYIEFLLTATPLYLPSKPIKTLVTSRLEKYRPQTEAWLKQHGIQYKELVMLNAVSAKERRAMNAHGVYKGEVYARSDAILFIESDLGQARDIAKVSRKPVICVKTHTLIDPTNADDPAVVGQNLGAAPYRPPLVKRVKQLVKAGIGESRYAQLKRLRTAPAAKG